ncbi:MAG: ABC transporter substrate-binding protein [Conexivisphaera sp.]
MRRSAISKTALWAIIAVVIIVVIVGGVAAYYATRPPPPKPTPTPTPTHAIVGQVTIGVATDLTGPFGFAGEELLKAAQLVQSQVNAQGGIYLANGPNGPGNYTVNVVWADDQTNPSVGPEVLLQLYTTYHPVVTLGAFYSGVVYAELSTIRQYNIIYIPNIGGVGGVTVSTPDYSQPLTQHYMIIHIEPTAYLFGSQIVDFLSKYKNQINPSGPIKIVYFGKQGEPTAVDEFNGLNQSIYQRGLQNEMQIVSVQWVPASATSFESTLSSVASLQPNVIVIAMPPPQIVTLLQQGKSFPQLQGTVAIAWTPADDPLVYKLLGSAASYYHYFVITNLPATANTSDVALNQRWQVFRNEFLAFAGAPFGALGSFGFDQMYMSLAAIQKAGSTNTSAVLAAFHELTPSDVPWPLASVYTPFPPNNTLIGPPSAGLLYNSVNMTYFWVEAFYNSTSSSVYTQVVWPPHYATAQPVL